MQAGNSEVGIAQGGTTNVGELRVLIAEQVDSSIGSGMCSLSSHIFGAGQGGPVAAEDVFPRSSRRVGPARGTGSLSGCQSYSKTCRGEVFQNLLC
jgi:hypothetical protein